jgi:acetoin utilization deacetylase AcuC-like enzyme
MARVGFITHPDYLKHDTGFGHPERPERLQAIQKQFEEAGLLAELTPIQPEAVDTNWLETAHTPGHIEAIKTRCEQGFDDTGDIDTAICPLSYDIGRLSAGAGIAAADAIIGGELDAAFCAARPPGHHAERDRALGFCLFNNAAIAARYLQKKHGLERVLIIDWDVHHGNGTQNIFEDDPTVFYFSTHQFPHYPWFSGSISEIGTGRGRNANMNAPMEAGAGDEQHLKAFDERLLPAMDRFRPEFVIVSAGFDGHRDDPLSATVVTEHGYAEMARRALGIAAAYAGGRLISVLEGGYDLASLARSVELHVRTILDG